MLGFVPMSALLPVLAAAALAEPSAVPLTERLAFWSWGEFRRLDTRLAELDAGLAGLAAPALVNSSVRIGLKTGYTTAEDVRWMELELPEETLADSVVLVPPLAKGANAVVAGYGFPVRFKVEVFNRQGEARVILDHTQADFANPGCYPVVARFAPSPVLRARLTATEPWTADGPEVLALAELLLLSGNLNLAVEAKVNSSSSRNAPRAWTRNNLVDMATPLGLPLAPEVGGAPGFHSDVAAAADTVKWLQFELPEALPLDEIRLIPVRRPEVPLWFDYGFPVLYRVECATLADFSDATLLVEVKDRQTPQPGMNPVVVPARQTTAKFVRLTATQLWYRRSDYVFALAEFQVYHRGENIAARGRFTASDELPEEVASAEGWSLAALADGKTEAGRLLELPVWFEQIARHQELSSQREAVAAQRAGLLRRTETRLIQGSVATAAGVSLLSIGLFWRQVRQRRRDAERLRQRLARDLHDEIGSNLGSITLICSLASQPGATLESLRADLADIERVAAESADSMRDMVRIIQPQAENASENWVSVLEGLTERLLRGHEIDLDLSSAPSASEPDVETLREIYLFCKEVLHNIVRHARAKRVVFHLKSAPGSGLSLNIADDGVGFDPDSAPAGHGLDNLRARAEAMQAVLEVQSRVGAGTRIRLDIPAGRGWRARPVSTNAAHRQ